MEEKRLTAKNMKETLVNWCDGDPKEYEKIYSLFVEMDKMGFISSYDWLMFGKDTWGWKIEGNYLIDTEEDNTVIFDFNSIKYGGEYRA